MSRLLSRYMLKDIKDNHNGNYLSFVTKLSEKGDLGDFREAVNALPGKVVEHFDTIAMLRKRHLIVNNQIHAIILAKAKVHLGLKEAVLDKFKHNSVDSSLFYTKDDLRRILTSTTLCKMIKFNNMLYVDEYAKIYNANTPAVCANHFLDSVSAKNDILSQRIMCKLILDKPALLNVFQKSTVGKMRPEKLVSVLANLYQPRIVKLIIEKNIRLPAETAEAIGEAITLLQLQGKYISNNTERMYRLLK